MAEELHFLLTSVGRRASLVDFFWKEMSSSGKLYVSDMSAFAAAMHTRGNAVILPSYRSPQYFDTLLGCCHERGIRGVTSLTDYELTFLAGFRDKLSEQGITFFGPDAQAAQKCLDKWLLVKELEAHGFAAVKSYIDLESFGTALEQGQLEFPVFMKPRFGSGSVRTFVAEDMTDVDFYFHKYKDMMIQEFIVGDEFGIDVYRDLLSEEVVSIFVKKKYSMRSGETDKAVSVKNPALFDLAERFVKSIGLMSACDIDVLSSGGVYYIFDVNPRYGGGYPLAYQCGCNFPRYMIKNLRGERNVRTVGNYREDVCMFKCDSAVFPPLGRKQHDRSGIL